MRADPAGQIAVDLAEVTIENGGELLRVGPGFLDHPGIGPRRARDSSGHGQWSRPSGGDSVTRFLAGPGCALRATLTAAPRRDNPPEASIHRLVLWNIDLTLLDVGRVTRDAYVEAFRKVTGRPLVQLPQLPGRLESGIFFDALALNGVTVAYGAASEELLARFSHELASAFAARRDQLTERGRLLPGAAEAVAEVGSLHGVVQSVLTGTIRPNAVLKLRAFGLDRFFDTEVGGYGSQVYPKGAQLLMTRSRAAEKYGVHVRRGRHRVHRRLDAGRRGGPDRRGPLPGRGQRPVHGQRAARGRRRRGVR